MMLYLYTDGACVPNPGQMAIGGILVYGKYQKEYSELLGRGTNNIAELEAIKYGLKMIKNKSVPLEIVTDSQYAMNSCMGTWKGEANRDLIESIQNILKQFSDFRLRWVRGHSGNKYNEIANYLANKNLPDEMVMQ